MLKRLEKGKSEEISKINKSEEIDPSRTDEKYFEIFEFFCFHVKKKNFGRWTWMEIYDTFHIFLIANILILQYFIFWLDFLFTFYPDALYSFIERDQIFRIHKIWICDKKVARWNVKSTTQVKEKENWEILTVSSEEHTFSGW